jgi:hypothetical protein
MCIANVAESRWVIDDVIESSGGSYSASLGPNIHGGWSTLRDWEDNPNIRVRLVQDAAGYQRSAVLVSGLREIEGASAGIDENGTYLRQPPLDDIEGEPMLVFISL